ncbi:MAG: VCBS repeat-containing protein, partial [Bacteroidota bacterium]|nr:VCBS repeat-containing protein [Bacteroidota bacterium]
IIAVNWIANEVLVFSGFGKMTFSDPSILRFSTEPTLLAISNFDSETTKDLIISMPDENKCQTYLNDGFGKFKPHQVINLKGMPAMMDAADINGDEKNDLAILSSLDGNLSVLLNDGNGSFVEDISFFAGQAPIAFTFYLPSKNNHVHVATLDTVYNRLRIFHNAKCPFTSSKVQKFSAGIKPTSIFVCDIDHDGWNDILIGNTGSKTLSIFKNYGNGNFKGQISFQMTFQITKLNYFSEDETTAVILSAISEENKIAVIELNPFSYAYHTYHFLTQGETEILHVQKNEDPHSGLNIFVLERDKIAHQWAILKYEQISSNRFIQRFYPLDPSFSVITASMRNYDGGNDQQVVHVAFDRANKKEHLLQTTLSTSQTSLPHYEIYSFDTSEPVHAFLQAADLNNDNLNDIILYLEGADNSFNIFMGQKDTVQPFSEGIKQKLSTSSVQNFKMKNVNNDNMLDIVYIDKTTRSLNVCFGKGDATFTTPVMFVIESGISDFDVADLNNDGKAEIILINALEGFMEIIYPPKAD